ncbi:MAG: TIGR02206 family membrane protein [Bryobacteraceae bacterium]
MVLFGALHLSLLAAILLIATLLPILCRREVFEGRTVLKVLACVLGAGEIIWWVFVYAHEGLRVTDLPLQLCDVSLWTTVIACWTLVPWLVEFSYFAGLAGAGMALVTPDLWSPWPSYPAVYFFVSHGGIVIGVALLVFGRIAPLRKGAMWRAFAMVVIYAVAVGLLNVVLHTNYMYLCQKPESQTVLSVFGPWPWYLAGGAGLTLVLFEMLWLVAAKAPSAKEA